MPVLRISEELFKEVQKYAEPLVDDFESVMWKILKLVRKDSVQVQVQIPIPIRHRPRIPGTLTPPGDFWKPILETLVDE